jgi:hypothetical protein
VGVVAFMPLVIELDASKAGIECYVLVSRSSRAGLLAGIRAALPGARLDEAPEYRRESLRFMAAAEFWLTSVRRPLAVDRANVSSTALLAALQPLHGNERVRLQWIVIGAGTPAPIRTATADDARAERLKQAEPMLRVVGRLGVVAPRQDRAWSLFGWVRAALRGLNAPGVQVSRRLVPSGIAATRLQRLALPLTRWPLPLNVREAAGLFGLVSDVPLPGLSLPPALLHRSRHQLPTRPQQGHLREAIRGQRPRDRPHPQQRPR